MTYANISTKKPISAPKTNERDKNKKNINLHMAEASKHIIIRFMVNLCPLSYVLFTLTRMNVKKRKIRLYNITSIVLTMKLDFVILPGYHISIEFSL